ncbi:hypothetical protein KW794_01210 [Candidatus Saccharibacteria bacterium]|nr:hypothetical protein [Candidatus Saccharibacteria bacterium]
MERQRAPQPSLPPHDVWLIESGEKLETPLNKLGIVDPQATIALVRGSIDPEYIWDPALSLHHFQWDKNLYPDVKQHNRPNPHFFRELPPHKGLMLREFENFLHTITLRPPVPEEEVMYYRIEAWKVASSLFKKAREVVQWERRQRRRRQRYIADNPHLVDEGFEGRDPIGEEIMQEILEKDLRGVDIHREQNAKLPPEFRFFDSEAPLTEIAGNIGRIAVPRSQKLYKALAPAA